MGLVRKCSSPRCFKPAGRSGKCWECDEKAKAREARRTERRLITEPWRALYDTPEWKKCARLVRRRDGNCCVRCGKPGTPNRKLSVHHKARVVTLWYRAQEVWEAFLEMATNPDICETLCGGCHKIADNEIRAEQGERASDLFIAKPRVPASQRGKRGRRR